MQQETGILTPHSMPRLILLSVVFLLSVAAHASAQPQVTEKAAKAEKATTGKADRGQSKQQVEFGIKVAQNNLWNEALYRWEKATELDPGYAAAWNNLAIAYEHEGRFEEAKKAYEQALALDPKNLMIRQNYDLFKEINDRTKRRNGK
jgi:Tfp pilus assembly protein PilF